MELVDLAIKYGAGAIWLGMVVILYRQHKEDVLKYEALLNRYHTLVQDLTVTIEEFKNELEEKPKD